MAQFDERLREARQGGGARQDDRSALTASLQLQQVTRERAVVSKGRKAGRRRKGNEIDLNNRSVRRPRRWRVLMALLILEGSIAVVAVVFLIVYLVAMET